VESFPLVICITLLIDLFVFRNFAISLAVIFRYPRRVRRGGIDRFIATMGVELNTAVLGLAFQIAFVRPRVDEWRGDGDLHSPNC